MARKPKSDETVVLRRPGPENPALGAPELSDAGRWNERPAPAASNRPPAWRRFVPLFGAAFLVAVAGSAAFGLWVHSPNPVAPAAAIQPGGIPADAIQPPALQRTAIALAPPPPAIVAPGEFAITLASEAEILADQPRDLTVFRFRDNPAIVVLDFASLTAQGQMLNRMAVFEEKDGFPHDRLLNDTDLDRAIRGGGDDPATFYYGHDYRAAALVRFFALADRDHIALTQGEQLLHRLILQLGWTGPEATGALISLPRLAADPTVDPGARATILRHELSHGEYFTNPAFNAFVQSFWRDTMTEDDRTRFRRFLLADHYDIRIEDLIVNESQAYMMYTPDPRFFTASFVGLPAARIDALRQAFLAGMPPGWLRDDTAQELATSLAPRAQPVP